MQHLKRGSLPKGYTLIELCCVITLVACIVSLSVQVTGIYTTLVVRSELHRLAMVITYLRRKAIIEQQPQVIIFSQTGYSADRVHRLHTGVVFDIVPGVKGPPSAPHKELISAITYTEKKLVVYQDGSLSSGAVYLTTPSYSCCYALTSDASEISGVRCYKYQGGWHRL